MRNNTFRQMEKAALARLKNTKPSEISKNTDIPYDADTSTFHLNSLGIEVTIFYPEYAIEPYLHDWHHLMLLHHLKMADGTKPTDSLISFRELPDGFARGEQFDRLCENTIAASIGNFDLVKLKEICLDMGAKIKESRADICAEFSFVPHYPLTLSIWLADDDLPGSGKMLLNSAAEHQLSTEDAVTIGELILDMLQAKYKKLT